MTKFFLLLFTTFCVQSMSAALHPDAYIAPQTINFGQVNDALGSKFQVKSTEIRAAIKAGQGVSKNNPVKITKTKQEAIQDFIKKYRNEITQVRDQITKYRTSTSNKNLGDFLATILPADAYPELDFLNNYNDFMYNVFWGYYDYILTETEHYNSQLIERNLKRYYASLGLFFTVKACEDYLKPDNWVQYEEYIGSIRDSVTKSFNKIVGGDSRTAATKTVVRQCKDVKPNLCKKQCQPKLCERGAIHGVMCKQVCQGDLAKQVQKCIDVYDKVYEGKEFPKMIVTGIPEQEALEITNAVSLKRTKNDQYSNPKYTAVSFFLEEIGVVRSGKYFVTTKIKGL